MVVTREGERLIRKPIRDLVKELDPKVFWRIHRGAIVNVSCLMDLMSGLFIAKLQYRMAFFFIFKTRPKMAFHVKRHITQQRKYLNFFVFI